jgi:hypothetical protein
MQEHFHSVWVVCYKKQIDRPSVKTKDSMQNGHKYIFESMWDVVVQDTHVLARMFAAATDGWMNESVLPL